jgi:BirA family biotin operon repressor/biotin-[acetyl-CoA-carboxylase] ligase
MRRLTFDFGIDRMATHYDIVSLEAVTSTQDEARSRPPPVLVVAGRQTAGRGRSGRTWLNSPRALAASFAFTPSWPAEDWPRITLVAGLAARDILACGLKWPNDLLIDGRKAGGILTESDGTVVVVGLGVNLWWPDPPEGFGAVHDTDPGPDVAADVASRWVDSLLRRLEDGPDTWGVDEYRSACTTIGRAVAWSPNGSGRAVGVDARGRLLVETGSSLVALSSGEVRQVSET